MHLHSTLNGRAGAFRLRGAAWEVNSLSYRGFLYVVPARDAGDGRHQVVDGEGKNVWELLERLGEQVISIARAPVERLDAHAVAAKRPERSSPRESEAGGNVARLVARSR
jgi:hypothetical protein